MRYRRITYRYSEGEPRRGRGGWISDAFSEFRPPPVSSPQWRPAADVCETAEGILVRLELAGVADEDVDVLLYPDALVVEGRRACTCDHDARFLAAEIRYGPFRFAMPLPGDVDPDGVQARAERGFLDVTIPRRPAPGGAEEGERR